MAFEHEKLLKEEIVTGSESLDYNNPYPHPTHEGDLFLLEKSITTIKTIDGKSVFS